MQKKFARCPFSRCSREPFLRGASPHRVLRPKDNILSMASVLRNTRASALTLISTIGLCLAGCAAPAAAPASDPSNTAKAAKSPTKPAAAPAEAEAEAAPSEASEESPKLPKREDEERDGLRKASRPPLDLLTGNNVVYVFNFVGSAKGEAAKAQCESQSEPAAVRGCLAAERSKIAVESARFVKDEHGQYWWVTYNRYKGNLLKWHKLQFL